MPLEKQGSCLCGATHLSVTVDTLHINACHCSMCRKWGGGPMLVVDCSQPPVIEGPALSVYDSSEWAQRGFCGRCGTHLFYRLKQNDFYAVPVGLLDGEENWDFNKQIFVDEKPTWYCFKNETEQLTGKEVFEQFT
ncbi:MULTISPECIES: GFA family protein [unclassified Pseudomonas]|uniref:GFA family protein n=1 Tax=unclassified Pseudomonas TaxID=196821 RepID=UPI0024477E1C|nr:MULTISPECIES: GFA family protein [unclassified Pseudomonas]MDH0303732.1 GFA family protein [Pseudomonas sp. GD04091]MDH1985973.1 GFA family protein [Pseudomonas sp. GD03689]